MINLILVIFSQLLLCCLGTLVLTFITAKQTKFWLILPYAYTIGSFIMVVVGYLAVSLNIAGGYWHYLIILLTIVCLIKADYKKIDFKLNYGNLVAVDYLLLILIAIKLLFAFILVANYTVIDSDATYINGYTPMSKIISYALSYKDNLAAGLGSPLGLSLYGAFPSLFTERWFDFSVGVSWWFAYLFIVWTAISFARLLVLPLGISLFGGLLFATIPLLANHAIRPGFGEIWLVLFLFQAYALGSYYFLNSNKFVKPDNWLLLAVICSLFCAFVTKSEGKMWVAFFLFITGSLYSIYHLKIKASKVIAYQIGIAVVILILWYNFGGLIFNSANDRVNQLSPIPLSKNELWYSLKFLWNWNSFGIYMWIVTAALAVAFIKGTKKHRLYIFYITCVWLAVLFFTSFTVSVKYTLQGTTPGRFLMAVIFIGYFYYCLAATHLVEKSRSKVKNK